MLEMASLSLALAMDLVAGEPPWWLHPVVWMGKLIALLERFAPRRGRLLPFVYGAAAVIFTLALFVVPAYLLLAFLRNASMVLFVLVSAYLLKCTFSFRALLKAARKIKQLLINGHITEARRQMNSLVSRDVSRLDAPLLTASTVESVAENTSDSFVAPLLYFLVLGVPGALLYRMANTWDSMVGYHGNYEYLGKFAARLDDVLNLVPARVTGVLMVFSSYLSGNDGKGAWKIMLRDHGKTESPNAGWPMSAAAGGLGLRLEKVGHYVLGDARRALTPAAIERALALTRVSAALWTGTILVTGGLRFGLAA